MLVHRSISVLSSPRTICSFFVARSPSFISLLSRNPINNNKNNNGFFFKKIHRAFGSISAAKANKTDKRIEEETETFLAEESVSWTSLGVSDSISQALCSIGLHRPSLIQAACIPAILSGADVVVGAETGSGKTHGYLVPLIHKLSSTDDATEGVADDSNVKKHPRYSLVLCPNVMLCEQVVRMANTLCDGNGEPLLKTAAICGRQGMSVKEPDIIVSTPVALLNYLYAIDHQEKHRRTDFLRDVKYVVFDEADLLLCGSFQNQVVRLINMLRFEEKQLARLRNVDDSDAGSVLLDAADTEEEVEQDPILEEIEDFDDISVAEDVRIQSEGGNKRDWRRVRKTYRRSKQYVFVAATLPVNGKQTAGGILKRMFPDAKWVSGNYLHCQNPRFSLSSILISSCSLFVSSLFG